MAEEKSDSDSTCTDLDGVDWGAFLMYVADTASELPRFKDSFHTGDFGERVLGISLAALVDLAYEFCRGCERRECDRDKVARLIQGSALFQHCLKCDMIYRNDYHFNMQVDWIADAGKTFVSEQRVYAVERMVDSLKKEVVEVIASFREELALFRKEMAAAALPPRAKRLRTSPKNGTS